MIRRMTTEEMLFESLRELCFQRPVEKISVKDIVQNCGSSTATFYRYFQDKYELLSWNHLNQENTIYQAYFDGKIGWREVLRLSLALIANDADFYQRALKTIEGQNSLFLTAFQNGYDKFSAYVGNRYGKEWNDRTQIALRFYIYGLCYEMTDWCLNGMMYTVDEYTDILYDLRPEDIKDILK